MLKKRKKLIFILVLLLLTLGSTIILGHKIYLNIKCKDLYFATEYQMVKGGSKNKLLRVQTLDLVFLDDDIAVIETTGLNKEAPHETITYKAYFKKGINSSWKLEEAVKKD